MGKFSITDTVHFPGGETRVRKIWGIGSNGNEAWGTIGEYDKGQIEEPVIGYEPKFDDQGELISAQWFVQREHKGP